MRYEGPAPFVDLVAFWQVIETHAKYRSGRIKTLLSRPVGSAGHTQVQRNGGRRIYLAELRMQRQIVALCRKGATRHWMPHALARFLFCDLIAAEKVRERPRVFALRDELLRSLFPKPLAQFARAKDDGGSTRYPKPSCQNRSARAVDGPGASKANHEEYSSNHVR